MLAVLRDLPQATFASKVEMPDGQAKVTREVDGGMECHGRLALPDISCAGQESHNP